MHTQNLKICLLIEHLIGLWVSNYSHFINISSNTILNAVEKKQNEMNNTNHVNQLR